MSNYKHLHNLGDHNILLYVTYDMWIQMGFEPSVNDRNGPTRSCAYNGLKTMSWV